MKNKKIIKKNQDQKKMRRSLYFKNKKRLDHKCCRPRCLAKNTKETIKYSFVKAPEIFSLIKNENEVLKFIGIIQKKYENRTPVFVNMDNVKELGNGAILLLLANMIRFLTSNISFNGSKPQDPILRKKLENSGFFKHLYKHNIKKQENYDVGKLNNIIYTHAQKEVDSSLADKIIEEASQIVWAEKRRCPGIQRTLVELMHNTNNHAGQYPGEKHWWISSNKNIEKKMVTISFMDFGKGIFDSLNNKKPGDRFYGWEKYFSQIFPWVQSNNEILRLILQGHLHKTTTGDSFRGKGLPGIYNAFMNKRIGKLIIISNGVYADVENNDFHMMKFNLKGTFVSCEINENIKNLKW